jgi:hypothetical protein
MITGKPKYFMFHIHRISTLRFLYLNFFSASFVLHSYLMVLMYQSISIIIIVVVVVVIIIILKLLRLF